MKGKTALITGSAAGIGYAIADALAHAGCNVVLHGIEPAESVRPQQAALEQAHGVAASYIESDLSDPAATERLIREVQSRHGGIDVLVNNAVTRHFAPIESFPVECWDRALAVNLSAAFHTIRLTLPGMRERGWGRIFNMTSVYGSRAIANRIDYVTTKTALLGMTRAVALETINEGITCNAICPGGGADADQRPAHRRVDGAERARPRRIDQALPGGQAADRTLRRSCACAQLLVFLCAPAGDDITGAAFPIEGGWLAC